MKITYDKVSSEYFYPLDSKSDLDKFKNEIQDHILEKIIKIRFGCNWKTTQEARLVQRGENFDIRINFCLKGYRSPIISDKKDWESTIIKFGGVLDLSRNTVLWSLANAKRYSLFLLLHEIGHIAYCIKHFGGRLTSKKCSSTEERWCESYALALDLAAGTGLFAAMVTQAFPSLHIHLTDISEAMLLKAQQRFANNPLVTYAVQEHLQLSAISEYDLILSALSIHHLEHPDKQDLFRKIYCALRSGVVFINADQALAPTPHGEDEYERQWLMDVTAAGVSRSSLEQARERMREDRNASLSDQLTWLSEAGFDNVGCWYKRFRFVVYGGTKMVEQDAAHRPDAAGAAPGK